MTLRAVVALGVAVVLLVGACANPARDSQKNAGSVGGEVAMERSIATSDVQYAPVAATPPSTPAPSAIAGQVSRKLVRNVELDLVASQVDSASSRAQALAVSLGGYVANVSMQRDGGVPRASVVLRVPADRLDRALVALRALGERVEREQQSVQDVTDQWVDLDARLRTLRDTETQLRALLAESRRRGSKLDDVMAVYRELTNVRTQIEQFEGQLRSLDQLAVLSTIQVQLRPDEQAHPVAGTGWRPGDTFRGSMRTLVAVLQGLGDLAIYLVVVVGPVLLLLALPIYVLVRFIRRRAKASGEWPDRRGGATPEPGRRAPHQP